MNLPRAVHMGNHDRGASLVEFAIVAPLLLILIFGIIEFGFVWRTQLTVANATQTAGRIAASLGTSTDADYAVLQSVEQSLGTISGLNIVEEVHIWQSNGLGSPLGGCGDPDAGGTNCNAYRYQPGSPGCDWFPCPNPAWQDPPDLGGNWGYTNTERDVVLDSDGLGVVGVTVYFKHSWITGLMPTGDVACANPPADCWSNTGIFRFEPLLFEDST